jgi:DNA mismatch endonuclease (patch repair protein)
MTDILSTAARGIRMSRVRQAGTNQEVVLRRGLHALGFRFRLNARDLPGSPDVVLPRHRVAIFVHGCFWHGHSCPAGRPPSSNENYWLPKLDANKRRDRRKAAALRALGWRVITVWGCELRGTSAAARAIQRVAKAIRSRTTMAV